MYTDQLHKLKLKLQDEAFIFIDRNYARVNKNDYKSLKLAVLDHTLELRGFENQKIDLESFDWAGAGKDRSWWWQIQSLPFLTWFISSFDLQTPEEKNDFFRFCVNSIINWKRTAEHNPKSPLAWHDHASAFRIRNIVNWLVFCWNSGFESLIAENNNKLNLVETIESHLSWLADDKNYSLHTNHGFDQSLISYTISLYFGDRFEAYRRQSLNRLDDELSFAFTDEGVHKENSPGYQKFMLARLNGLISLRGLGDEAISVKAADYVDKANKFLSAITLPNGILPIIGDTRWDDQSDPEALKSEITLHDYSKSGYLIAKGRDHSGKEFCLIFKCCHDSNYHRHDDDLSIVFFYDGNIIFGDGGLYNHNEKDEKRIFIRSPLAHSMPTLPLKAQRDRSKLNVMPSLSVDGNGVLHGISYMYGVKTERSIDVSNILSGAITICDKTEAEGLLTSNFMITDNVDIKSETGSFFLDFGTCQVTVQARNKEISSGTYRGWDSSNANKCAIYSKYLGKVEDATRIWLASSAQNVLEISFK